MEFGLDRHGLLLRPRFGKLTASRELECVHVSKSLRFKPLSHIGDSLRPEWTSYHNPKVTRWATTRNRPSGQAEAFDLLDGFLGLFFALIAAYPQICRRSFAIW